MSSGDGDGEKIRVKIGKLGRSIRELDEELLELEIDETIDEKQADERRKALGQLKKVKVELTTSLRSAIEQQRDMDREKR